MPIHAYRSLSDSAPPHYARSSARPGAGQQPVAKTAVGRRQQRGLVVNQMIGQRTGDGLRQRLTSRPCVSAGAMNERRSNAIPIPANAASVTPLESVNTGPRRAMRRQPHGLTPQRPVFTMFIVQQRILRRSLASVSVGAERSAAGYRPHQVVIQQAVACSSGQPPTP